MPQLKTVRRYQCKFHRRDYQSNNGFQSRAWGPMQWFLLHMMSFNYPTSPSEEDKKHYKDFVVSLQHVLPCRFCRENLKKNLAKLPLLDKHLRNRDTFSRYIYNLHELVNKMLCKKSNLSFCEVRDRFEHLRSHCGSSNNSNSNSSGKSTSDEKTQRQKQQPHEHKKPKEKGCITPLHGGIKRKCVLHIVPIRKTERKSDNNSAIQWDRGITGRHTRRQKDH